MRKFCAVACGALAILATTAADAQQVATSFAQLQVLLKAGDTVYITEDRGQPEWQAKIVDVTASSLVVSIDGVRRELSENNVQRIRRRLPDSRKNGALIGFLVGAAGSTAAAKGLESPPGSCAGGCLAGNVLYGGGVGALVGLGIDALIQGKKDIYLKNAATRASLPRPWRPVTGPAMNLDVRRVTTPPVPEHMLVSADAGYPSDDFDGLQEKLKSGDSIVVSSDDGTRIKGRLVAVSSDRITLSTDKGTRDIAAERVTRVQLRRNGVMLGAVIGTAIGIPFGIALKSYANNEGGSEAGALAFPIAVGAGAGLGIDALLVRPRTVFERHALSHGGLSFGATHQRASVRYTIAF